jgi:hypothetical protein
MGTSTNKFLFQISMERVHLWNKVGQSGVSGLFADGTEETERHHPTASPNFSPCHVY